VDVQVVAHERRQPGDTFGAGQSPSAPTLISTSPRRILVDRGTSAR
jgi:hypothetical protein